MIKKIFVAGCLACVLVSNNAMATLDVLPSWKVVTGKNTFYCVPTYDGLPFYEIRTLPGFGVQCSWKNGERSKHVQERGIFSQGSGPWERGYITAYCGLSTGRTAGTCIANWHPLVSEKS